MKKSHNRLLHNRVELCRR